VVPEFALFDFNFSLACGTEIDASRFVGMPQSISLRDPAVHIYPPPATAAPIYATCVQFPVVCFSLTLLSDIAYWRSGNLMWQNFSSWLLFVGLLLGAIAIVVGLTDFFVRSRHYAESIAWPHVILGIVVLALAFVNSLVHAADGWIAVVPYGLVLSLLTVIVMMLGVWVGFRFAFRRTMARGSHA
jgi:uncharacterized membrane protein